MVIVHGIIQSSSQTPTTFLFDEPCFGGVDVGDIEIIEDCWDLKSLMIRKPPTERTMIHKSPSMNKIKYCGVVIPESLFFFIQPHFERFST